MYVFKVGEKEYKIKYSYGVLYKTDLIDRVISASTSNDAEQNPADALKNIIGLTAELLLAGLQKRHSDEFGWETDEERERMILAVLDLIDDYEDEHENEDGTFEKDGFTLFADLQGELEKNGFLSRITQMASKQAANQNATKIPSDHKKSTKAGTNK